jgi:hypothetical protein
MGNDVRIGCALHADIAHMDGIVAWQPESLCYLRRQGIVHQEFHGAIKGSSRSLTAPAA